MLEFDFTLIDKDIPKKVYFKYEYNYILHNCIDYSAYLLIKNNDNTFFYEGVAIVEFYWFLINWYNKYIIGDIERFEFNTIEWTSPMLTFSKIDNDLWEIDSEFANVEYPLIINSKEFDTAITLLIQKLTKLLCP